MEKIDIRNEYSYTDELLFKLLMQNENPRANDVRDFLLEKHRNEM